MPNEFKVKNGIKFPDDTIQTTAATAANASGTWGISITGNAATATALQTARAINGTNFNGTAAIETSEWIHSGRDFPNGTLIQTTIDYSQTQGDPWVLEIKGNSYGNLIPIDIQYQGYIYNDTVINHGGYSNGSGLTGLVLFNYNGKLCFWFPYQVYWQGFNVRAYSALAGRAANRVTSITNEAKPAGVTKEVALSVNIRQSLHSSNYNSYSPSLTGSGASGSWAINVTGSAGSISNNNIVDYLRITNAGGAQRLLMGNQDSVGVNNPAMIVGVNGQIEIGNGSTWSGSGGTFSKYATFAPSAVNITTALQQSGNQVLHAGNYNSYSPSLTGSSASGTWGINITGSSASTTGNAATATTLQTARTINGTSFNGSTNITTASWGTARTLTIGSTGKSVDGSANASWSVAEIGAQAADADLTAIAGLAGTSGVLKKTAANTWTLDTATFITDINIDNYRPLIDIYEPGVADYDDWYLTGFYTLAATSTNSPDSSVPHNVYASSPSLIVSQLAIGLTNKAYTRASGDGGNTWTSWGQLVNTAPGASGNVLTSNGSGWVSQAPSGGSPRVASAGSTSGTLTPNGNTTDTFNAFGLTGAITVATPSGTPVDGQRLILRFEDNGTARGITWTGGSGAYRAVGITLPTTTTSGKVTYVGCIYNSTDVFWDVIAVVTQA